MPNAKIVIIGGGSSGLSAAGALKHHGIDSVILDRDAQTGAVWDNRYERLHLHTIRGLSHMPYYRPKDDLPRYMSKAQYAAYMREYAEHFKLDIRHNTQVSNIKKAESGWQIEIKDGEDWQAEICIVATGINHVPFIPNWKGKDSFQGQLTHGFTYKSGHDFAGKRVLIVGIGNTGAEICADLVEQGASLVHNSVRQFPMIVKRDPFGIPLQMWGLVLIPLPVAIKDPIANLIGTVELGDLSPYGIKPPEWTIFKDKRIPMIDVGYIDCLKQGKITVKPDVQELTENGVIFADGTQEDYDVIIAATGYRSGLQKFLDVPDVIDGDGKLLVACGEPNQHEGLWFIGLGLAPAGVLLAARIESRKMAKMIAEKIGQSN